MRSYWRKRFRDLRWRHIPIITSYDLYGFAGQQLCLIHCWTALESSRTARLIIDVGKQVEKSTTENTCIIWVVTWPWVQGHDSTTKSHRNFPLADLVYKGWKVRCAKNQISIRASAKMLTWWAIAHAVDSIAHPVTGISWILPTQWKWPVGGDNTNGRSLSKTIAWSSESR